MNSLWSLRLLVRQIAEGTRLPRMKDQLRDAAFVPHSDLLVCLLRLDLLSSPPGSKSVAKQG